MQGKVLAIFIAASAGEPMGRISVAPVAEGHGILADRYAKNAGAWSKSGKTIRHVTLIASEAIEEANRTLAHEFEWEETRRNIITKDVDLNSLVGKEFRVGDTRMRGVELAEPCDRPSKLSGKPGFKEAFAGHGGLRAEVIMSGTIAVDDPIIV